MSQQVKLMLVGFNYFLLYSEEHSPLEYTLGPKTRLETRSYTLDNSILTGLSSNK
jgi:hypothetical protein